jgi:hypothetical protein
MTITSTHLPNASIAPPASVSAVSWPAIFAGAFIAAAAALGGRQRDDHPM